MALLMWKTSQEVERQTVKMMRTLISLDLRRRRKVKRLREECGAQYESKKAKNPALVANSSILLDAKPWGTRQIWQNERRASGTFKQTAWFGALLD